MSASPPRYASWLRPVSRIAAAVLIVASFMMVDWHGLARSYGQGVGPAGCVALCGDGGGGGGGDSYGGGAGCAAGSYYASVGEQNADTFVAIGNDAYDDGRFATAAGSYQNALDSFPGHEVARGNLAATLIQLGVNASRHGNLDSAYLYYERSIAAKPHDVTHEALAILRQLSNIKNEGSKNCSVCGRALINDTAYGLDNSASLWNYVNQASINYQNCTRRIADRCEYTAGKSFSEVVRKACLEQRFNTENALRGCVRQALADAR